MIFHRRHVRLWKAHAPDKEPLRKDNASAPAPATRNRPHREDLLKRDHLSGAENFGSFGQARGTDPRQADRQKVLSNLVAGAIKSSSAIGAYNTTERWSRYPSRISPEAVSSNHNMSRVIYDRG